MQEFINLTNFSEDIIKDKINYVDIVKNLMKNYENYEQFFINLNEYEICILRSTILSEMLLYYYKDLSTLLKTKFLSALISITFSSHNITISVLTFLLENIIKKESHNIIVQSIQQTDNITADLLCFIERIVKIDWIFTKAIYTECNLPEYITEYASKIHVENDTKIKFLNTLLYIFQTRLTKNHCFISYNFNIPLILTEIFQKTYDTNISILITKCFKILLSINISQTKYEKQFKFFDELKTKSFSTCEEVKMFIINKLNISDLNDLVEVRDRNYQHFLVFIKNKKLLESLLKDPDIPKIIKESYFTNSNIVITPYFHTRRIHNFLYNKDNLEEAIELFDLICIPNNFEYLINDLYGTDKSHNLYVKMYNKCKESYKFYITYSKCLPTDLQNEIFDYVCPINHTKL